MKNASDSPSAWPGNYKEDKKQKRPDRALYTPKRKGQSPHSAHKLPKDGKQKHKHGSGITSKASTGTPDSKRCSIGEDSNNLTNDNVGLLPIDLSLKDNPVGKDIQEDCQNVLGTVLDLVCNGISNLTTNAEEISKLEDCNIPSNDFNVADITNESSKEQSHDSKHTTISEHEDNNKLRSNAEKKENNIPLTDTSNVKNLKDCPSSPTMKTTKLISKLRSDLKEADVSNQIYRPISNTCAMDRYREPITWKQPEEYGSEEEKDFDDWDHNWNEDGDCLDKSLRKELKKLTNIRHPVVHKTDLSNIGHESDDLNDIDSDVLGCGNILEIYGFSPNYKTSHLALALTTMGVKDYEIQWVDDTSALVIFESMMAAASALSTNCAYARLRCVADASPAAKAKAKLFRGSRRSYKARPETTAHVARNLVANALGLCPSVSKERRAADREKIRKAKAEKIAREKHRRDIWES